MKRTLLIITLLLLVLLAAVLASLNAGPVNFDYYLSSLRLPLAVLLLAAFVLGVIIGLIFSLPMVFSGVSERRHLRKQLALSQQEIRNLRGIPIKGPY